ncbi:MFS transporter [Micromonospora sp. 4G57]|uniref:MFS transporter n=1 Tax=Micromonospora sicca TaxID=2202420 RepID=A0ABU5JNL9_9ACTN|nr:MULTISPECIES: MFS transporter [unclassified Micromonospora]MDZ5446535.1 MFS transporter [Micromonospora sp. 4G57]MDZ5494244.1 MFS transporter [Micromonospora sp. 4G53]
MSAPKSAADAQQMTSITSSRRDSVYTAISDHGISAERDALGIVGYPRARFRSPAVVVCRTALLLLGEWLDPTALKADHYGCPLHHPWVNHRRVRPSGLGHLSHEGVLGAERLGGLELLHVDRCPVPAGGLVLAPLRYGVFRYLAAGRMVNMLGNAVAPIALAFAVLDLTGSVRDLGLVVGVRSLMTVLFVLFGGVMADRIPRWLVLVGSNVLGALTQAAVAALVLTGTATIPLLLTLGAANGIVSALSQPASAAATPQTVPPELIQQANALIRLGINAGMIGGAALGGLLVAAVGPGWGLAVDALTFAMAAMAFTGVRVAAPPAKSTRTSIIADLRVGWTEFTARTWVWVVVLGFMILNAALAGGVNVLGPAVADETIGRSAWGVVLAAETAGMVIGGLIALRIRVRRLLLLGVACMFAESFLLLGLALAPTIVVLLPAGVAVGLAVEQFAVAWDTSIAQHIPADRLARVYSYDMLGSWVAIPLGQIAVGPVAAAIGTRDTLLILATLVVLAVLGMLTSRDVRRLRAVALARAADEAQAEPADGGPSSSPTTKPTEPAARA